jgi:uncharacterized protein (DUF885 family)
VVALPDGAACYRAAILEGTTLALSPEDLHALGLERLAALRDEMQALAERSFATSDVAALFARLDASPEFRYASRDEIIARAEDAVARARASLPKAFTRAPRGAAEVRPYPDAQAQAGAPASASGTWRGDRYDGVYFINTWAPERRARVGDEAIAFHETYPGHILQTALTLEGGGSGLPTRYLLVNASYEGWALYAERLADELALYSSDADRLGLLRSEAFRAARLVADTGLHALGWPAERAARVLADAAFRAPADVAAEVDRYCAWPAQALGYMVGALEIRALRARAEGALGRAFDLRAFHDALIADGNVSLPVLRAKVERWIEGSR